jgi:hypothetical protein
MIYNIRERDRLYRAALLEPSPEYIAASFRLRSLSGASESTLVDVDAASVVSEPPRQTP